MATARRLAIAASNFRYGVELNGLKNGFNTQFMTPEAFVLGTIRVERNGQRLFVGASNDYTVSESGGVGTGYDTINFNGPAPKDYEILLADYVVAD